MSVFKTTQSIFNSPWAKEIEEDLSSPVSASSLPPKSLWKEYRPMTINDVELWEQLYYKTGDIGIYAAWNPYSEFYIIVHNLFINSKSGIEEFYGNDAAQEVWDRANELGVKLTPF